MQNAELKDITIIGGGPSGLFAAFYAGMRGVSCRIIDSLPELGGQLMALYPEKYIYDVGGYPRILARDLARNLIVQGTQFGAEIRLEEQVQSLRRHDDHLVLSTDTVDYPSKTVIIAGGKGAFTPRELACPGYTELVGKGVEYHVRDPAVYQGKRILIVGGGDSAVDWALGLKDLTVSLTIIHRREGFRAHPHSMKLMESAVERGEIRLLTYHEVREIHGANGFDRVDAVTIFDNRSDEDTTLRVDAVLALIGFKPDLGPIGSWGLELERNTIRVDHNLMTNIPGVFVAGDIAHYDGKLELIATGFGEAAMAVNHAVHLIDPKARYNPGHSTNLKVFREKEEALAGG
ncbi:MAG: NAD(P)/FAD-dependent oxidoreductase [Longimicrobiales bacterium]